jgi:glycosyltransferase involved in cell wall biosynthesis
MGNAIPGWTSIAVPVYFIGGIQLLSLGIIGEYIGKIYKEVKKRPRYIIEKIL